MQKVRCAVRKIPSGNEKYLTSVSIISVYLMKIKSHLLPVPLKIIGMIKQWTTFMSKKASMSPLLLRPKTLTNVFVNR